MNDEINKLKAEIEERKQRLQELESSPENPDVPLKHIMINIPGNEKQSIEEFSLSKYPVTRAQFNEFIKDSDGYYNDVWWKGFPVGVREETVEIFNDKLDHPVTGVNWYEAKAYCRWLSNKLGVDYHLPSEAQWYQAATGGDPDNIYPWGSEMKEDRCNCWESNIHGTTPVNKYPKGATKQGLMDMSGNVWEWCEDECTEE